MHYDPELTIKLNVINIRKRCSQEPFDLENLAQIARAFHQCQSGGAIFQCLELIFENGVTHI